MLLNLIVAYCAPVTMWVVWKKKSGARTLPLIAGMIAYLFISLFRGVGRIMILNSNTQQHIWLYNILSALLSGVFEEVGRYVVFRWCIPEHDRWSDCVSYGIGHGAIEVFLLSNVLDYDIYDCIFTASYFVRAICFSVAMSVLVFPTVHHTKRHALLFLAIGLHNIDRHSAGALSEWDDHYGRK